MYESLIPRLFYTPNHRRLWDGKLRVLTEPSEGQPGRLLQTTPGVTLGRKATDPKHRTAGLPEKDSADQESSHTMGNHGPESHGPTRNVDSRVAWRTSQKGVLQMKRTSLYAAFFMIGLLLLPQAGRANMTDLSDDQLCEITGQAGIVSDVTRYTINTHVDTMPVMHGFLTLTDVTVKGTIDVKNPETSGMVTQVANSGAGLGFGMPGLGMMGLGAMTVGVHRIDTSLDLERMSIGAIHIGSDITGPSLGSLDILNMHATVRGTVAISTH